MSAAPYETLRRQLKQGRVYLPGEAGYKEGIERWSLTCIKQAAAVALPCNAEETSVIVRFATSNHIPFTVRGGGHSTSGSSAIEGGLVIDLSLLRSISIDLENKTVTFGGGCKWGELDNALFEHGLATVGGTVSHTGVGGLIIGGGYGSLSPRYGLTIDNLLEVEVVLANGTVVRASKDQNKDLFWAVRGAGASFGVVTTFKSKCVPIGNVWAGTVAYPLSKLTGIVDACNYFLAAGHKDTSMTLGFTCAPPPQQTPIVICTFVFNGPAAEAEQFYGPFLKLKPFLNTCKMMTYPQSNALSDRVFAPGRRYQFGGSNVVAPLKPADVTDIVSTFFDFSTGAPRPDMKNSFLLFELMPNAVIRSVPPQATAHAKRGDYYNVGMIFRWADPKHDHDVRMFNRELTSLIARRNGYAGDTRVIGTAAYNNYVQGPMSAEDAFGANSIKLIELKKRYDPDNVFDKQWKLVRKEARA